MRAIVKITKPAPGTGVSYGNMGFGKYGVCCWQYAEGYGPVHFVNFRSSVFEPEYEDPVAFKVWLQPGTIGTYQVVPHVSQKIPDQIIGGVLTNIVKGKGFPLKFIT